MDSEKFFWNVAALIECGLLVVGIVTRNTSVVVCSCTYILMWQNWMYHGKK